MRGPGLESTEMLLQYRGLYKYYISPILQSEGKTAEDSSGVCGLSFQQFYKFMLNKQVPLNDSLAKSKGERIPAFCAEYSDVLLLCSNFVAVIFSHLSAYFPARYIYKHIRFMWNFNYIYTVT